MVFAKVFGPKKVQAYSLLLVMVLSGIVMVSPAKVAAGSGFTAGRIIDNSVFTDTSTLSAAAIQTFLNGQVPNCDTNGAKSISYYYNNGTGETHSRPFNGGSSTTSSRAVYGQRVANWFNAHPSPGWITNESVAPYVCVQNYIENPSTGQNNLQNPGASIAGGQSAAQIIYNAAQQYQINPEVLLVTLQKEQALVTDDWPWTYEYAEAMGFNCPDNGGCSGFSGFYQQVNAAAKQYRNYLNNPNNFNYVVGNNTILYSPAGGCGSSVVNIQTLATAALYDYTPYQPDQTVLNNTNPPGSSIGPGTASGDTCAAYGNRNFWWYFNSWFGASIASGLPGCAAATNTTLACIWNMSNPTNFDQYLTSSINTRDELFTTQNYQYLGIGFYGNVVIEPGNLPVYRASTTGGGSFLTTDKTEYNSLVAGGWTGNGVDFYADPPTAGNAGFPVYRLYNRNTGQHYWTADWQQHQTLMSNGWTDEGIPFMAIDTVRQETPPPAGKLLVYRFYIPQTYEHFWTTDLSERDGMIGAGYQYEGVAWYSSANTANAPVYRLYAPSINQHLYTTDLSEKNNLVASGGWNYEGISQYVSTTANSQPVYRLYAPSLGVHFLTADANERNQLLASGNWNNEGVAWYQPQ